MRILSNVFSFVSLFFCKQNFSFCILLINIYHFKKCKSFILNAKIFSHYAHGTEINGAFLKHAGCEIAFIFSFRWNMKYRTVSICGPITKRLRVVGVRTPRRPREGWGRERVA